MDNRNNPKQCPAPDHCRCIARCYGDPTPEEEASVTCVGVRLDDNFPGKEKAIGNMPSDIIVSCDILGAHSDDQGPHTVISNVEDQYIFLEPHLIAMNELGLLKKTFKSIFYGRGRHLKEIIRQAIEETDTYTEIKKGQVMTKVFCRDCDEEIYRWYNLEIIHKIKEHKIWNYIEVHFNLEHDIYLKQLSFNGKGWDEKLFIELKPKERIL